MQTIEQTPPQTPVPTAPRREQTPPQTPVPTAPRRNPKVQEHINKLNPGVPPSEQTEVDGNLPPETLAINTKAKALISANLEKAEAEKSWELPPLPSDGEADSVDLTVDGKNADFVHMLYKVYTHKDFPDSPVRYRPVGMHARFSGSQAGSDLNRKDIKWVFVVCRFKWQIVKNEKAAVIYGNLTDRPGDFTVEVETFKKQFLLEE